MNTCKGVFNEVKVIDDGAFKSGHVYANRIVNGQSDFRYNTGNTIKQLIEKRKLFVCVESNVTTSRIEPEFVTRDPRLPQWGGGAVANETNQENPNVVILVPTAVKP